MSKQQIEYIFNFKNGTTKSFLLQFDEHLNLLMDQNSDYPQWCELYYYKCPTCTLNDGNEYCSAAICVYEIFQFFNTITSINMVDVEVHTKERIYKKEVPTQKAISSIVGLSMASSNCPILSKLKPFVKQHLPFASSEETVTRIISFYLLAQYYKQHNGNQDVDWNLVGLKKIYDEIRIVNKSFFQRISNAFEGDSDMNSIAILESLADSVNFSLDGIMRNDFQELLLKYF